MRKTSHFDPLPWAILVLHAGLLGWIASRTSPNVDEVAHLPAGISYWQFGDFQLYSVNPPLVRFVAAAPVLLAQPKLDWDATLSGPQSRPEWQVARRFIAANGSRFLWYFRLARWACLVFPVMGGYFCWKWANALYGRSAGLIALILWSSSPMVLAWGSTITPDVPAGATGIAAGYCLTQWLRRGDWRSAVIAGLTLGIALLTKTTWMVLFALWPVLWAVVRIAGRRATTEAAARPSLGQLCVVLVIGLYCLNAGYGFEGTGELLRDKTFVSRTLAGEDSILEGGAGGNRFTDSLIGWCPVPLPRHHIRGMDLQKYDFEKGRWSFLDGEWRFGGWWYYYLVALLYKVPLGTWLLAAVALAAAVFDRRKGSESWIDELVLAATAMVVLALISSQTGINRDVRYVIACFPFAFVWISRVGRLVDSRRMVFATVVVIGLVWTVVSSMLIYPNAHSYFNELAGGPAGGPAHLLHSNVDWGEDLLYLRQWYEKHPHARPLYADCVAAFDLTLLGMEVRRIRSGNNADSGGAGNLQHPAPGWYAISLDRLYGRRGKHSYFQTQTAVDTAGYSIRIYHVE